MTTRYILHTNAITESANGFPIKGIDGTYLPKTSDGSVELDLIQHFGQTDPLMIPMPNYNVNTDNANDLTKSLIINNELLTTHASGEKNVNLYNKLVSHYNDQQNNAGDPIMASSLDFQSLENDLTRIMTAFAAIDGVQMVTDNNRKMMMRYMSENTSNVMLARSNYEAMVANVSDMRDTYYKTQEKVMNMSRLNEVQTYYKMYYGAKKKIILETILVVVMLVILHTLRRNGILPEGLFNVFFVIILFVYIFFRLSWQIADFISRDKRYFDKYEWGQLDGSYNFYKFIDPPAEVSYSEKARVNKCLNKFFTNLSNKEARFANLRSLLCSYTWMLRDDILKDQNYMHTKMLYVVIYETLFHRYIINAGDDKNEKVWNACVKKEINTCQDAATEVTSTVDDEKEKSRIFSEIVNTCDQRESDIENALASYTSYTSIVGHINLQPSTSTWKTTYDSGDTDAVIGIIDGAAGANLKKVEFKNLVGYNADWCIDMYGIVQVSYYFATFYEALSEFLKQDVKDRSGSAIVYASQMYFKGSGGIIGEPNTDIIKNAHSNLSGTGEITSDNSKENKKIRTKPLPQYTLDNTALETLYNKLYEGDTKKNSNSQGTTAPATPVTPGTPPPGTPPPAAAPTIAKNVFVNIFNYLKTKIPPKS